MNLREPNDGDNKLSQNLELVLERIVGWSQHLEQTLAEDNCVRDMGSRVTALSQWAAL